MKFILVFGVVKTIGPNHAITGMKVDKSKGGFFGIANGDVISNLGSTRFEAVGILSGTPVMIRA